MKIITLTLAAMLALPALAGAIEEAGISGLVCRVWRSDTGTGSIEDRVRCVYSTHSPDGVTVRRGVTTSLPGLNAAEQAEIAGCIETVWAEIYSVNGFPQPTPRPSPGPTPEPE
jgi:hypothetical protein